MSCSGNSYQQTTLENLKQILESDLDSGYPPVVTAAGPDGADDPGAQRCIKWGEKVTAIQKSLINRYESRGEDLFDGFGLYICEACGFIAVAEETPQICPVCKAPSAPQILPPDKSTPNAAWTAAASV